MGLPKYILEAVAKARGLQCKPFDALARINTNDAVYYWHSFNGVDYIRYELVTTPTDSNICVTGNPKKIPGKKRNRLSVHTPSPWHFVEAQGMLYASHLVLPADAVLYIGDESPARVRVNFTAERLDD